MFQYLNVYIRHLLRNKEGATAIEYGLLAALIAVAIIATVAAVGTALNGTFTNVETGLTSTP
jgi:pilus assembly protein Flp/PilA